MLRKINLFVLLVFEKELVSFLFLLKNFFTLFEGLSSVDIWDTSGRASHFYFHFSKGNYFSWERYHITSHHITRIGLYSIQIEIENNKYACCYFPYYWFISDMSVSGHSILKNIPGRQKLKSHFWCWFSIPILDEYAQDHSIAHIHKALLAQTVLWIVSPEFINSLVTVPSPNSLPFPMKNWSNSHSRY